MTSQELITTFDRFFSENNGKFVERVDSNALNQCFDLAIYWCEYLGFPKSIFSGLINASQIYTQWTHTQFDKIPNTPEFVPQKGDICVFSGTPGHVSVATGKGDLNTFESFDQNFPTGSASHLMTHNYNNLLGVQRLKVTQNTMDRRPYWFDLINRVVWNKPHEQIKDSEVELFTKEYPNQKAGNGKWSQLCNLVYQGNVDSNKITVEQLWSEIHKNCNKDELKKKVISFVQSL